MFNDIKQNKLLTNKLIKTLHKISQPYTSKKFTDNDWRYVQQLIEVLRNVDGVEELYYGGGKYHNFNEGGYKEYNIDILTSYGTKIKGEIRCHFAGTMENPYSSYDMTVNFYKNTNENMINEGINNNNYTHFAVNKQTNLIVNGWDYSSYDSEELRQFKKDYFLVDLVDNDFNPKEYKILSKKGCLKQGINPDDDSQWSNDGLVPCGQENNNKIEINECNLHAIIKESIKKVLKEYGNTSDSQYLLGKLAQRQLHRDKDPKKAYKTMWYAGDHNLESSTSKSKAYREGMADGQKEFMKK